MTHGRTKEAEAAVAEAERRWRVNIAYNADCLAAMREMPDNAFDLAVVDPPYGDGCSQIGNVERERAGTDSVSDSTDTNSQPKRMAWKEPVPPRGADILPPADARGRVHRTGGTWAEKFGKKSLRGTLPRNRNTSTNCFASHAPRSSGGAIILTFRRRGAFLCGERSMFRSKVSQLRRQNMRGQVST